MPGHTEERRSRREAQRSTFAESFGLFDFRLLQQYLPQADITLAMLTFCAGHPPTPARV
jgi:hypothetical protein